MNQKPLSSRHRMPIALNVLLSFVTCGIYNIYWNKKQFEAMNELLGRHEYSFALWLCLSLLTCGLFHVYYEYKMGRDLARYLSENGYGTHDALPIVGLVLSLAALTVIADAIYQQEINNLSA